MAALRSLCADDPVQDARDITKAERELERLRYMAPRDEDARLNIRRQIEALERGLARMRAA